MKNITWHEHTVTGEDTAKLLGHSGAVLWFTGLSGSGKSTVANALHSALYDQKKLCYVLDGDNVRHGLNSDLGFSPEDRTENIRRISEVAHLFCQAGVLVCVAFVSPYAQDRSFLREKLGEKFVEVYMACPLDVCEERDPKGLYKKARDGSLNNLTGVDAPYEIPEHPDLTLDTSSDSVTSCVEKIIDLLTERKLL